MIYEFDPNQDGKPIVIDTESPEFKNRIAWLCDMGGLEPPVVIDYLNISPGMGVLPTSLFRFAQILFKKDGRQALLDIRCVDDGGDTNTINNLQGALMYLSVELGLKLSPEAVRGMIYTPPAPPKIVEDWEQPGALIGEPVPGQDGWFRSRKLSNKECDVWTGKSGAVYRLKYLGSFAFFRELYWHRE